jgi:hypothetical protein
LGYLGIIPDTKELRTFPQLLFFVAALQWATFLFFRLAKWKKKWYARRQSWLKFYKPSTASFGAHPPYA